MNNIFQIANAVKNPQAMIQQMMNNSQIMQNPIARNAIEMYQRGDREGINRMAENLCKEKGVKPDEITQQIKSMLGI